MVIHDENYTIFPDNIKFVMTRNQYEISEHTKWYDAEGY